MQKLIKVVPYNPAWSAIFAAEALLIKQALDGNCLDIHHVGSTSVPKLAAKPKIDIIVVTKNSFAAVNPLQKIGYKYKGEYNIPMQHFLSKKSETDFNVHLYEQDHAEIELNLVFRDYLRKHAGAREAYQQLKYEILKDESAHQKANSIFVNYTLRKADFIRSIIREAGFDRLRIVKCLHETEWKAAKYFRDQYFFKPHNVDDPYTWTFNHSEHAHLILYQGVDIIGYAHLQFWSESRVAIRIIVIDQDKRSINKGSEFLALIEQWLKSLGVKSIHAESRKSSLEFYQKNGYTEMPFNDPANYETDANDIAVGKML